MKRYFLLSAISVVLLCLSSAQAMASSTTVATNGSSPEQPSWGTPTRSYSSRIRTVTAIVGGQWQSWPIMHLQGNETLDIDFDELSTDTRQYLCQLQRCEPDWTVSSLFENDWLDGNNDVPITAISHSLNTTVAYTHYAFTVPNDWCRITMSGNYRLLIYDSRADSDNPVAEIRFMVVDPQMRIGLQCSANTDVDANDSHQQLTASVDYGSLRVIAPERQLHTVVMQNWQQPRIDARPTYQGAANARWEHTPDYIFLAGNEYRKFEMLATSHATMGIEHMEWDGHHFQAYPFIDTPRINYLTDEGAKGFSLIRNSSQEQSSTTCDYVWVNYRLQAPYEGERYVFGFWADQPDRQTYLMHYDMSTSTYEASILQKQGYYSYVYQDASGNPASYEGNFFATRNRYEMLVYYRPIGGRSWLLTGFAECEAQ